MIPFILFLIYTTLPPLITVLAQAQPAPALYGGIALFLFQITAEIVLFKTKSRRTLIAGMVIFFLILIGGTILGGFALHWSWFSLLSHLYPGPFLTVVFIIIYKLSRPSDFEKLARGLNRITVLLLSYSLMLLMIRIHHLIYSIHDYSAAEILFGFYEGINYLPAVFFLSVLRDSTLARFVIYDGKVWFKSKEITSHFNEIEMFILKKTFKGKIRIRCREGVPFLNRKESLYICSYPECKASLCPAYALMYRNIKNLDKKLENLGLGYLLPPENKRDIVEKGWIFASAKDITTREKPFFFQRIPALKDSTRKKKDTGFIITLAVSLIFAALLMLLLPLTAAPFAGEEEVLFLAFKALSLLAILFMIRYPVMQGFYNLEKIKKKAPQILFWLIWFYMAILSLFMEPVFPGWDNLYSLPGNLLVAHMLNRIILFTLFSLSVGFFSKEQKPLRLTGEDLTFNNGPLPPGLSDVNRKILNELVRNKGETLRCDQILEKISPGEAQLCPDDCKPSACPRYQKIYKRIQAIRKYLQIGGIGTIASPERKADSHKEGWSLVLYEDVYFSG